MSSSSIPPATFTPPPIPVDQVHFTVEVDRTRCSNINPVLETRLDALEQQGLQMTIAEIVIRAGMHFAGGVVDRGEGLEIAQIRHAWHWLMDWELVAVPHQHNPARMILRVANQPNSRLTAHRSEVLAFGIGLEVASRLYDIEYQLWETSEGLALHDLQTWDSNGALIRVEVRGRIDRTNVGSAVVQVHEKFVQADFSQAAGVIVFPRTTNSGRGADIMVLDPVGDRESDSPNNRFRVLLRHYAPFFYYQGGAVRRFGERLRELSNSDDAMFDRYLESGDQDLLDSHIKYGRTGFVWDGVRYVGTIWDGVAWPKWLVGMESPSTGGVFFWGLSSSVIQALRVGRIQSLVNTNQESRVLRGDRRMIVILADQTALLWAPTRHDLDLTEDGETV